MSSTERRLATLAVLGNGRLRRVLAAYLIFNVMEWATWIALLVFAYDAEGVRGASAIALVQLVPSAILATPAAAVADRMSRARALSLGYAAQAVTLAGLAAAMMLADSFAVVAMCAAPQAIAVTFTRPVHLAILPELSRTTRDLTAANAASGTVEALANFLGPLVSGLVVAVWSPAGVVATMSMACAVSVLLTATGLGSDGAPAARGQVETAEGRFQLLWRDPTARVMTVLVAAEYTLVGLMDILLVVLALDLLGMPESGPGVLNSALGVGAFAGAALGFVLVGRQRLAPALLAGALLAGVPFAFAGLLDVVVPVLGLIAVSGAGKLFFDVTSRTIIHRSLPDRLLTAMFGVQESIMMAGLAAGSLATPFLVELVGPNLAFLGAGLFLPLVALLCYRAVRRIDAATVVPLDVLAALQRVPMLAVLPPRILERLARDAQPVEAEPGEVVVAEGEPGRLFYVVRSGMADVSHGAEHLRRIGPGGWFGELALLRDVPRTATVTAGSGLRMWALERGTFLTALAGSQGSVRVADDYARDHYR